VLVNQFHSEFLVNKKLLSPLCLQRKPFKISEIPRMQFTGEDECPHTCKTKAFNSRGFGKLAFVIELRSDRDCFRNDCQLEVKADLIMIMANKMNCR
jgi:hypothetical protein